MEGSVLVTDDAIPPVKNGWWLVVLASVRTPPKLNRLAPGTYVGYQDKWKTISTGGGGGSGNELVSLSFTNNVLTATLSDGTTVTVTIDDFGAITATSITTNTITAASGDIGSLTGNDINVTGNVTASAFIGDGSQLTNIDAYDAGNELAKFYLY